ncbi:MAG TPA: hypothetical protein DCS82_01830 [Rhodospirillaceae bacterium]|nr:hypothetical protein [Rhodospirillaceae bacterium]HAT34431.1 hypothetical protein [Rhodospirillaceae bacterium]
MAKAWKCPFEQSWAYGEAIAATGGAVHRAVLRDGKKPIAFAQIFSKRLGRAANLQQLLRGPVFFESIRDEKQVFDSLNLLAQEKFGLPRTLRFWTPEVDATLASGFKKLRWRRVMSGYHTAWLDLDPSPEVLRRNLDGNWRNGLAKAEKKSLRIRDNNDRDTMDWLLAHYENLRRKRRFGGPSPALLAAAERYLSHKKDFFVLRAFENRTPVAGVLLARHGKSATYVIGWSDDIGRRANANNLLLWQGLLNLKSEGVRWLDLGGIDTQASPGIARFKLGLGGEIASLSGTYF